MKKLFVSLTALVGMALVATSSVGAQADPSTGKAQLHPINQSGVKARISFLDTGNDVTGLVINGTASGLDPDKVYFSVFYRNSAAAGGPRACVLDRGFDDELDFAGQWVVNADGTGTLFRTNVTSAYAPLSTFLTVSVLCAPVLGRPETFELVACGKIIRHR
jgi:hypothetical protein